MLWNRRAFAALEYLEAKDLPRHDYQMNGVRYVALSEQSQAIAGALAKAGFGEVDLLAVDYFMWRELQIEDNLGAIHKKDAVVPRKALETEDPQVSTFIHNDVRDKIAEIGEWLGFKSRVEVSIAPGSKVDAVWEATIGNMGRVIYVFEVQTKGSVDSLIVNLLKSMKNAAVQGIVAVTDQPQIEKIKAHSADVAGLHGKLRFWDYQEVLRVHEALAGVNESINRLGLVPAGF